MEQDEQEGEERLPQGEEEEKAEGCRLYQGMPGIYIMQNTMVKGGGIVSWGKKIKIRS